MGRPGRAWAGAAAEIASRARAGNFGRKEPLKHVVSSDSHCRSCGDPLPSTGTPCPRCLFADCLAPADAPDATADAGDDLPLPAATNLVAGRYRVLGTVGGGGMGTVFRAWDEQLHRLVALKVMSPGALRAPHAQARFLQEAQAAARLSHEAIVSVFDQGRDPTGPFLVMQYIEGADLARWAERNRPGPRAAAGLVAILARAMEHAHASRVLHRDLKPSNVLVDRLDRPYLTDFGLAKLLDAPNELTVPGSPLGTPGFLPPEQASSDLGPVGEASDIYGLGGILYFLLTGSPPFPAAQGSVTSALHALAQPLRPVRRLNSRVPVDLETICHRCLEQRPQDRLGTARELAAELERFLRHEPLHIRPPGPLGRLRRWARRHPGVARSLALALGLLGIGIAAALWLQGGWRQEAWGRRLAEAEDALQAGHPGPGMAKLGRLLADHPGDRLTGERLLSALSNERWLVPLGAPLPAGCHLAAFSRDGRWLACASTNLQETLHLRELTAPFFQIDLPQGRRRLHGLAFSTQAGQVVAATSEGAWSWDWRTRSSAIRVLPDRTVDWVEVASWIDPAPAAGAGSAPGPAIPPTNRHEALVAIAGADLTVHSLPGGEPLAAIRSPDGPFYEMAMNPQGTLLATVSEAQSLTLWSLPALRSSWRVAAAHQGIVRRLTFSPDGRWLATAADDGTLAVWDPAGRAVHRLRSASGFTDVDFSADAQFLATASEDGRCAVYRTGDSSRPVWVQEGNAPVRLARFAPTGLRLISADGLGRYAMWDLPPEGPATRLLAASRPVGIDTAQFGPDGRSLLTIDLTGEARLQTWAGALKAEPRPAGEGPSTNAPATSGAMESPPDWLAALGGAPPFKDLACWEPSRSGAWAALGYDGGSVVVARAGQRTPVWRAVVESGGNISAVRFCPDGARLAVGTSTGRIRVFHTATGRPLTEFLRLHTPGGGMWFSPRGDVLGTGGGQTWTLPRLETEAPPWLALLALTVAADEDGPGSARDEAGGVDLNAWRRRIEGLPAQAPETRWLRRWLESAGQ